MPERSLAACGGPIHGMLLWVQAVVLAFPRGLGRRWSNSKTQCFSSRSLYSSHPQRRAFPV